jgi:hypothetical protein
MFWSDELIRRIGIHVADGGNGGEGNGEGGCASAGTE